MLRVEHLRKVYDGREVVRDVGFAVRRGECFGILGPNGAGKTTTLRCCLGLTRPDGGTLELGGRPVPRDARQARYRVGVVPQFDNLDPDFTVTENLVMFARYFDIPARAARARVPQLLEFAGLGDRGTARLDSLSSTTRTSCSWTNRRPGSIRRHAT
jgi:lipooligosaccharide transport system ATP-binding protein